MIQMKRVKREDIVIRSVTLEDFETVERLCTIQFGEGYLKREEFALWCQYPDMFLAAEYQGKFVGYVSFLPSTPEEIEEKMAVPAEEVRRCAGDRLPIHCRGTAAFSEFQGMGIMYYVMKAVVENTRAAGYHVGYLPGWKYYGKTPVYHLIRPFGFVPYCQREMLWYGDEDYTCIVCKGRCTCSAVIYRIRF